MSAIQRATCRDSPQLLDRCRGVEDFNFIAGHYLGLLAKLPAIGANRLRVGRGLIAGSIGTVSCIEFVSVGNSKRKMALRARL
jgi:hypothetical protein